MVAMQARIGVQPLVRRAQAVEQLQLVGSRV
jgi:hypothetical protein